MEKIVVTVLLSYATVPFLVQIYRKRATADWNAYAIVAIIDLAKDHPRNPAIPAWLSESYRESIAELAQMGLAELQRVKDPDLVRAILSVIAIWKGARTHARVLINFSESEVRELAEPILGNPW